MLTYVTQQQIDDCVIQPNFVENYIGKKLCQRLGEQTMASMQNVTVKVNLESDRPAADPNERDPSRERKLAIERIMNRWRAMTISVDEAESELATLFGRKIGEMDIEIGQLEIKNKGLSPFCDVMKLNGADINQSVRKLTLTIQAGHKPIVVTEHYCLPKEVA
jgi:hypothetical protein